MSNSHPHQFTFLNHRDALVTVLALRVTNWVTYCQEHPKLAQLWGGDNVTFQKQNFFLRIASSLFLHLTPSLYLADKTGPTVLSPEPVSS